MYCLFSVHKLIYMIDVLIDLFSSEWDDTGIILIS